MIHQAKRQKEGGEQSESEYSNHNIYGNLYDRICSGYLHRRLGYVY